MNHEDYHLNRVKIQNQQAKLQFIQVLIQAITLLCTLNLLGHKL